MRKEGDGGGLAAHIWWGAAAALSAGALWLVRGAIALRGPLTPIDQRLPLVAIVLLAVIWLVREERLSMGLTAFVPLLVGAMAAFPDREGMRLLAYGLIVAATYSAALMLRKDERFLPAALFVLCGAVLLRWLVISEVRLIAEVLVALGALAILAAFRPACGPLAVFASLASVLIVPAVPLRSAGILFLIALAVAVLRLGRLRIMNVPAVAATAAMLMLFSWSGVMARGFPYFWRSEQEAQRLFVGAALPAGQSIPVATPPNSAWLIVSGANVPRFEPESVLGVIQPGNIPITVADAADWGYMRRQHFWSSKNVLPRRPAGELRDYGYSAWVDGAGRVALPPGATSITVTASRSLPADARLQIHAVELR